MSYAFFYDTIINMYKDRGINMKIIFGLGNPGKKYEYTKHNVGFLAIDQLANQLGVNSFTSRVSKHNALIIEARFEGKKVLLVKPLTYMNLSGEAIKAVLEWYKVDTEDMVIVYDDLDLPLGKLRLRERGSAGGHNGVKSIIQHLGTEEFKRVRIGIGHPDMIPVIDYVLTTFSKDEKGMIEDSLVKTSKALKDWLAGVEFNKVMSINY